MQPARPADGMFVALLEATPDAMVCIAADGRIALVNAQAERLFGYERGELPAAVLACLAGRVAPATGRSRRGGGRYRRGDPEPGSASAHLLHYRQVSPGSGGSSAYPYGPGKPARQRLEVHVRPGRHIDRVRDRTERVRHLCCYVRDDGAGLDPAYEGKLFQSFQRLHAARDFPGTGTGLASVRQIVERHGGHVRDEGAVGAGATFYFTLGEKGSA